jgi:hypothetical protein
MENREVPGKYRGRVFTGCCPNHPRLENVATAGTGGKKKVSRHETIRLVSTLQGRAFDLEQYKSLLNRGKGKKPERIMEWLEREADPLFE